MKVRLRPLLSGVAVAAALVAVLLMGSVDSARGATTFNPTFSSSVEDPTVGASSNFTSNLAIPDGDVNFAAFIGFIPQQWGVITGDNIPLGAQVGELDAQSVLGVVNGACSTTLPVHFDMLNGSLDLNDTVSFDDTDDSGTGDYAEDLDGNGFDDSVDKYPDWLNRIFTDDGTLTGAPMQPIRRSTGITLVAGTAVILQFLIFPPGTQIDPAIPNDETLGFPSVTVLQNIGDESSVPQPGPINDFCTPLDTINISYGQTEAGDKLFVNPGDGTYEFNTFALGQRDADGDSYENSLDTCALVPNIGNPRLTGDGDLDNDGLDQACDPNDATVGGTNSDEDGDGYLNRQDNCPLDANGEEQDNQEDKDLDTIGDQCDPDPTDSNAQGTYTVATPTGEAVIGAGGAEPGAAADCVDIGCYDPSASPKPTSTGGGGTTTAPAAGSGSATATPPGTVVTKDDGSNAVIFIVIGVAAAVIIVGGGAALLMRRRNGA